jgi:Na+/phosphate symporter|tara:strand:+ start:590 stop:1270 length:681 start_codon:yes stop_codon:yes gene_type:complete
MSIFREIVRLWKIEDLLFQAWDESYQMMTLSNEVFNTAISYLRDGKDIKTLKNLKKRDQEINAFQKNVRKKVVTHFSISKNVDDLPSGLVLLNIVVDIERVGDYTKNILDLAINHPNKIISEDILEALCDIENEVLSRFRKTLDAINAQDEEIAKDLLITYKKDLVHVSDEIVNKCIAGEIRFDDEAKSVTVALYARYLKRIGAHLKNITTTIINPYEYVGYKTPD